LFKGFLFGFWGFNRGVGLVWLVGRVWCGGGVGGSDRIIGAEVCGVLLGRGGWFYRVRRW